MNSISHLNLKSNLKDKYIAFLDVMGFSNLVNRGNVTALESYFETITQVLQAIRKDKAEIESFLISDSIILIAPNNGRAFTNLLLAIKRIQSALLWKQVILRGAVSFGEVYYNKSNNIVVGKGFIKAYLLEQEAIFPRVIIDPSIIKKHFTDRRTFINEINHSSGYAFEDRLIYMESPFSKIVEDGIFIDYANTIVSENKISGHLKKVYSLIEDHLYSEQKLYTKYIWLRDYFLETLKYIDHVLEESKEKLKLKKDLVFWIDKFESL